MEKPWKVISNADGVDKEYATLDEALKEANSVLSLWREQAHMEGEWDEDVEFIEVHLVTHAARIVSRDGDNEDDGVEYGITEILGNEIDAQITAQRAEISRLTEQLRMAREGLKTLLIYVGSRVSDTFDTKSRMFHIKRIAQDILDQIGAPDKTHDSRETVRMVCKAPTEYGCNQECRYCEHSKPDRIGDSITHDTY